jgi:hypothetical protein
MDELTKSEDEDNSTQGHNDDMFENKTNNKRFLFNIVNLF